MSAFETMRNLLQSVGANYEIDDPEALKYNKNQDARVEHRIDIYSWSGQGNEEYGCDGFISGWCFDVDGKLIRIINFE